MCSFIVYSSTSFFSLDCESCIAATTATWFYCMYVCMYVYVYTHVCIHAYVCTHVCIYVFTYAYVHIHACIITQGYKNLSNISRPTTCTYISRTYTENGVLLASLNAFFKIDPSTFAGWMRILKSVPTAYLVLAEYQYHKVSSHRIVSHFL
jgi:hypothetical protein